AVGADRAAEQQPAARADRRADARVAGRRAEQCARRGAAERAERGAVHTVLRRALRGALRVARAERVVAPPLVGLLELRERFALARQRDDTRTAGRRDGAAAQHERYGNNR